MTIVSHRHRYVFVRTRKTASTSIELSLRASCGDSDIITPVAPRDELLGSNIGARSPQNFGQGHSAELVNHSAATEIRAALGVTTWNNYFRFCVERNPWEKVVSLYFHRYKRPERPSMDDFLESGEALDARNWNLYTEADLPIVDVIVRYENLHEELGLIAARLGLEPWPKLVGAKSQFRADQRPAREILSPTQIEWVRAHFVQEIRAFGYVP